MNFKSFLREVKDRIEYICPKNPLLGLALFLTAILRQVLEKDKTLAERIVKHLEDMTPLIMLYRDKKHVFTALSNFRVPDMRGRVKPKKLQNISEEYEKIYEKVKTIFKRGYINPEAKIHDLKVIVKDRLGMNIPKDKVSEWLDCKPSKFACKCLDFKYGYDRHPETIMRQVRKERKEKQSISYLLWELAKKSVKPQ